MSFTTGTATDYLDLFEALRAYLVSEGWTQLAYTAPAGGTSMQPTTRARMSMRGPGAGAGRETFLDFQSDWDAGLGAYSIKVRGMTDYTPGALWGNMPNNGPESYLNLWPNSIDYWFYVNDRRVVVVAKVGSNYLSMYAGFFLPFALPTEYDMPLYIGANYYTMALPAVDQCANRMIADPGLNSASYLDRQSGTWHVVSNHLNTANVNSAPACSNGYTVVWPHGVTRGYGADNPTDWNQNGFLLQRPNANDELGLWQCHLIDPTSRVMVGALDGVYATGGHNRAPEQVVTFSARDFRLFSNVFRSTANDFMAIEEL